jgi:DNA topoisomerase-1
MWILFAGGQPQWTVLRHNGPFFPEPYQVKNLKVKYQNQELNVDDETEEKLYAFVKYLDTDYINNSKFKKNFWSTIKKSFHKISLLTI